MNQRILALLCSLRRLLYHAIIRSAPQQEVCLLPGKCGFFSNMFMTLNGIRLCEVAGARPKPFWGEESLFFERSYGPNAWEYYFKTIGDRETTSSGVIFPPIRFKPDARSVWQCYPGVGVRQTYHQIIRNYVILKDHIAEEIKSLKDRFITGKHVLGVHLRFTDRMLGFERRKGRDIDAYFQAIDGYCDAHPVNAIFVATDYSPALRRLQNRYGSRVVSLDCMRSNNTTSVHGHYDDGLPGSPYLKGLEVIRDAYVLASVSFLIRVHSRVSAYSLCLNPSLEFMDLDKNEEYKSVPWLFEP